MLKRTSILLQKVVSAYCPGALPTKAPVGLVCADAARLILALFGPTTIIGRQPSQPIQHDALFPASILDAPQACFVH